MHVFRPVFASALLIALAMGGVVLPVLHDAAHAAERVEVTQSHSDHHHHQLEDAHGIEVQPDCPDAAELDLVCALCVTPPMAVLAQDTEAFEVSSASQWLDPEARAAEADAIPRTARGPPAA